MADRASGDAHDRWTLRAADRTLLGAHHKTGASGAVTVAGVGKANEPFFACKLPNAAPLPLAADLR